MRATTLKLRILGALAAAAVATPAGAVQLFATSYDTPNGDGQAHSGSFNYWDAAYTGSGLTTMDGAPLSGGVGDLTDGVVANDFWFNTENNAGTGPYVGWRGDVGVHNPIVTFHFLGAPIVNMIAIHLDNSLTGGVGTPDAILIDGTSYAFTGPANRSAGAPRGAPSSGRRATPAPAARRAPPASRPRPGSPPSRPPARRTGGR